MDDHPNLKEFKKRVKCDGYIYILKGNGGIIKKKELCQMTVDLEYVKNSNIFIDNDGIVYYGKN